MYRPLKYTNMSLYDWVQQLKKEKGGTQKICKLARDPQSTNEHDENDLVEQEEEQTGDKRKKMP